MSRRWAEGPPPPPPPWGALITASMKTLGMSGRAAARLAGISEGRWRQVTAGYEPRGTEYAPVHGPAGTVARMAFAVGVTPAELTAAGRRDAAIILAGLNRDHADTLEALIGKVAAMTREQARLFLADIADRLDLNPAPPPRLGLAPAPLDDDQGDEERRYA